MAGRVFRGGEPECIELQTAAATQFNAQAPQRIIAMTFRIVNAFALSGLRQEIIAGHGVDNSVT
jgi:hypothetical protein